MLLILVIGTAIAFDFTNGFHDTGNAMATSIATGALKPKTAVGLSAVLNLIGAFLVGLVARAVFPGKDAVGWPMTILLGFIGGIVGKLIFAILKWPTGFPMGFVASVAGAFVLLWIWHQRVNTNSGAN